MATLIFDSNGVDNAKNTLVNAKNNIKNASTVINNVSIDFGQDQLRNIKNLANSISSNLDTLNKNLTNNQQSMGSAENRNNQLVQGIGTGGNVRVNAGFDAENDYRIWHTHEDWLYNTFNDIRRKNSDIGYSVQLFFHAVAQRTFPNDLIKANSLKQTLINKYGKSMAQAFKTGIPRSDMSGWIDAVREIANPMMGYTTEKTNAGTNTTAGGTSSSTNTEPGAGVNNNPLSGTGSSSGTDGNSEMGEQDGNSDSNSGNAFTNTKTGTYTILSGNFDAEADYKNWHAFEGWLYDAVLEAKETKNNFRTDWITSFVAYIGKAVYGRYGEVVKV